MDTGIRETMKRTFSLTAVLTLAVTALSCGEPQRVYESRTVGTNGEVGDVLLRNVHVRPPAGNAFRVGDDGVVVLAVFNRAGHADALIDVRPAQARDATMHWDRECDGTADTVSRLPLLADGGVAAQGGAELAYHLRLVDFTDEVLAGTTTPVTFVFERAGETTLDVLVETTGDGDDSPPPSCSGQRW